jgi:acylpyruvate hydrolase
MSKYLEFFKHTRNIFCIGRNFAEHAKELSNATPSKPFWFLKPTSTILRPGNAIVLPRGAEVHHEVELAIVVGRKATKVKRHEALDYGTHKFVCF